MSKDAPWEEPNPPPLSIASPPPHVCFGELRRFQSVDQTRRCAGTHFFTESHFFVVFFSMAPLLRFFSPASRPPDPRSLPFHSYSLLVPSGSVYSFHPGYHVSCVATRVHMLRMVRALLHQGPHEPHSCIRDRCDFRNGRPRRAHPRTSGQSRPPGWSVAAAPRPPRFVRPAG